MTITNNVLDRLEMLSNQGHFYWSFSQIVCFHKLLFHPMIDVNKLADKCKRSRPIDNVSQTYSLMHYNQLAGSVAEISLEFIVRKSHIPQNKHPKSALKIL